MTHKETADTKENRERRIAMAREALFAQPQAMRERRAAMAIKRRMTRDPEYYRPLGRGYITLRFWSDIVLLDTEPDPFTDPKPPS